MSGAKSKNKGKTYERDVANFLSELYQESFTRVPYSGAYVGGRNFHRAHDMTNSQQLLLEGDIVVPEELADLKFECKTLKKFSFSSLYHKNATLDSWLEQAHSDDKMWFLVFKINNRGSFVAYDSHKYEPLLVPQESNHMQYKNITITRLDGFFELNKESLLAFCSGK